MKLKALAISAIGVAMLTACSGSSDKVLTDKSTPVDSLSYVIGQMAAMQRGASMEQDSTLQSAEAQKAFDQGFEDGLKLLKGDNDAYNQGLLLGLQNAFQMQDLKKNGVELNRSLITGGYKNSAKDSVNPQAQRQIQELGARLLQNVMAEKVTKKLDEVAKKGKYTKKDKLYYKVLTPGKGENLKKDQKAMIRINLKDVKGAELIPGLKENPNVWTVGDGQIQALDIALPMMNEGASYELLVAPQVIFGNNMPPMVNPNEPVILVVDVVSLDTAAAEKAQEEQMKAAAAAAAAQGAPAQAAPAEAPVKK